MVLAEANERERRAFKFRHFQIDESVRIISITPHMKIVRGGGTPQGGPTRTNFARSVKSDKLMEMGAPPPFRTDPDQQLI